MHAYRDAIRRSSGAYVLYPGVDNEPLKRTEYHEVLPGVGAFVLRPTENGQAATGSVTALHRFLDDALDHVAAQGTSQERSDFWTQAAYREREVIRLTPQPGLTQPPADTQVLLGFVRNQEHWDWVTRTGLYNLRADDRPGAIGLESPELAAELVLLYSTVPSAVRLSDSTRRLHIKSADELVASGYPSPGGNRYCCIELGPDRPGTSSTRLDLDRVLELARRGRPRDLWAAPTVVTWTQLAADAEVAT